MEKQKNSQTLQKSRSAESSNPRKQNLPASNMKALVEQAQLEINSGLTAYRQGEFQKAEQHFKSALESSPLAQQDIRQVLVFAAASAYFRYSGSTAQAYLQRLFKLDPQAKIHADIFPPAFCNFAEKIRKTTTQRKQSVSRWLPEGITASSLDLKDLLLV